MTKPLKVMTILGTRPEIIRLSRVMALLDRYTQHMLVHTGQNYDYELNEVFFSDLGLREPDVFLNIDASSLGRMLGNILMSIEPVLHENRPDAVLILGDTNSSIAAIMAKRKKIPVYHMEAGNRSFDPNVPEEVNRLVTDAITNWFFTTSEYASGHLRAAGVEDERIFFVGNTMIDTLLGNRDRLQPASFYDELGLANAEYLAITLHRPTNVDEPERLAALVHAICDNARGLPVIFPVHPRPARNLDAIGELPQNLHRVDPQPYLEFIHLIQHARAVVTDSGGITEEATVLDIPCMTLRDTTERPETVKQGTNALLGTDATAIAPALDRLFAGDWQTGTVPPLWDGKAAGRIVGHLERLLT